MANGLWPDLATWRGPTPNTGPAMREQRGMVIHIAEGYYEGTIAWQKNASADVSSHFVIAGPKDVPRGTADGKTAQLVDCDIAAWTQRAGNGSWVSAENCGFAPNKLSAAQIEANAQLFARGHKEYGWPLQLAGNPNGRGLGYHSMGSNEGPCDWPGANWGHCACPGKNIIGQLPLIVARATEIVNGDDMSAEAENQIKQVYTATFFGGPSCGTMVPVPGKPDSNSLIAKLDYIIAASKRIEAKLAQGGSGSGVGPLQLTWTGTATGTGMAIPAE